MTSLQATASSPQPCAPPPGAAAGRWNAFVEAGRDRAERTRRLACCPRALRTEVEDHVRTAFAIRRRAAVQRRRQTKP